jgi:hypothetical protein
MPPRRAAEPLRLSRCIEVGHTGASGSHRAQRRVAGLGWQAGDRENRQHAVPDEF